MATINCVVQRVKLSPLATTSNQRMVVQFEYFPASGGMRSVTDTVTVDEPLLFTGAAWELAIRGAISSYMTGRGDTLSRVTYVAQVTGVAIL